MRMLNLGCGTTFHKDWINIDFTDHGGKVLAYDLRLGIPFADAMFDVVYHSHVLEHMPKAWGEFFLRECFRVLRPGGVLRVVVPDLESITRAYLENLEAARRGEADAEERHQWMIVELMDQLTRSESGGEMLNWWKQAPVPQEDFIIARLGKEAEMGIALAKGKTPMTPHTALPPVNTGFLLSGERHTWMYDAHSLQKLLCQCQFSNVSIRTHDESAIPQIIRHGLDTTAEGHARKPDSLFMEAVKPYEIKPSIPRVTTFSTTDAGGAAIAALRLHNALNGVLDAEGQALAHSQMYVAQQHFFQDRVHVIPSKSPGRNMGVDGAMAEKAVRRELGIYGQKLYTTLSHYPQRPKCAEYFSIPGQCVAFEHVPFLEEADILHFHWIAGLCDPSLSLDYLRGKKIVWTLHDMNAFTGGCHYSNGCRKFEKMCCACPELGSKKERDLAFDTWRARMKAYRELDIHVVAPSAWLAKEAQKSALLGRFPVHHIPYAQPLHVFKPLQRHDIRRQLSLQEDRLVLLFASQSLANTRKGSVYLIHLLHALAQTSLKERITVFMLGNNAPKEFMQSGIAVECLGHIDNPQQMAALYNAADAVLVPSLEDNQPNVICEALACGTPVVAFNNGGIGEMIHHQETGYLTESKSVEGLLHGVLWADGVRNNPLTRRLCRARAVEQWDLEKRAREYSTLYKSIL